MFDDMPNATIATGVVDGVLTFDVLAQEIAAFVSPAGEGSADAGPSAQRNEVDEDIEGIIELIRKRSGLDLTGYKTKPLTWRIQQRMELRKVPSMDAYQSLVHDDPVELETLIRGTPIHVTEFFRDPAVWATLQRDVIPKLIAERARRPYVPGWRDVPQGRRPIRWLSR